MKKYGPILFTLLLCLLLCWGCGSKEADSPAGGENGELMVLHLSVNPELQFSFDQTGIVRDVQYLNSDAETACKDLKLTGMTYQDALFQVVTALHGKGYLEGKEVSINVSLPPSQMSNLTDWENKIMVAWTDALNQNNTGCSFRIDIAEDPSLGNGSGNNQGSSGSSSQNGGQNSPGSSADPSGDFDDVELDANGNIIKSVEKLPDGTTVTAYYYTYPEPKQILQMFPDGGTIEQFFRADGTLERQLEKRADGVSSDTLYEADGKSPKEYVESMNGQIGRKGFYQQGILQKEIFYNANGTETVRTYHANGKKASESWTNNDGSKGFQTFHQDGWLKSQRMERANGTWDETVYQAKDLPLSQEWSNGVKYIYDKAGNLYEFYDIDNHGQRTHGFKLANGIDVVYTKYSDGHWDKVVIQNNHQLFYAPTWTGAQTAEWK